jgi:hypothetical protein
MPFFSPDLYRSFGLGFVAGALIVSAATADQWGKEIAPAAQAAEVRQAPEQTLPEFVIEAIAAGEIPSEDAS